MAYAFKRSETVQASQVTGTHPDFPALFWRTVNEFRTIGNGGNVTNANGYDLNLFSDSGLTTILKTETERYVAATGEVIKWGKVPSIAVGTVVYWGYGDSGVTTDRNDPPNTWPSQYWGVWHLADGGNSVVIGSTASGYYLTNSSSRVADAAGKIGRGCYFSGTFASLANASIPTPASLAVSWWQYVATADVSGSTSGSSFGGTSPSDRAMTHHPYSDSNLYWDYGNATDGQGRVHTSYSSYLDAWTFVTLVYDNSSGLHAIYLNGALIASHTHFDDETALTDGVTLGSVSAFSYWIGTMDEARIANAAPSADWIAAEYNNQSAPTSFWGLGSEQAVGGGGTFLQHPGMAGGMRDMLGGMRGYRARPRRRHTQNPDFQVRAA